jgi:hypothetical protein
MAASTQTKVNLNGPDLRVAHGLILLGLMVLPSLIPSWNQWPIAQLIPAIGYAACLALSQRFAKAPVGCKLAG